jgi:hypothetical protein
VRARACGIKTALMRVPAKEFTFHVNFGPRPRHEVFALRRRANLETSRHPLNEVLTSALSMWSAPRPVRFGGVSGLVISAAPSDCSEA